jgi:integrase
MASLRKRGKVWYFRYVDADGVKRNVKGCSDKRATEELARDAETQAARVRAGLSDPKAERMAREARRPIGEHIDEFIASMEVARRNEQHISQTRLYVTRLCELARVERLADLTPSGMTAALGKLREQGFATRTVQAYATAVKAFSKWAWRDGRTVDYTLNALVKPSDPTDRRRVRRPLTEAELRTLIETTRTAPTWRGVSGLDRSMMYRIASLTGFRRDELLSLTPASFRLDDRPPVAICESGYTKNGQRAEQPLPASSLPALRAWVASKPARRPVFDGVPRARTGMMLQLDLERAEIPFETPDGVVDLHSLRHGYITTLARSGVPVKTLQVLARHADPRLTMNTYAHASLFDTSGAVESLPDLSHNPRTIQANAATGTDGPLGHRQPSDPTGPAASNPDNSRPEGSPISKPFGHHLATAPAGNGRELPDTGVMIGSDSQASMRRNPLEMSGLDGSGRGVSDTVVRVADGIRTRDIQIHNLAP